MCVKQPRHSPWQTVSEALTNPGLIGGFIKNVSLFNSNGSELVSVSIWCESLWTCMAHMRWNILGFWFTKIQEARKQRHQNPTVTGLHGAQDLCLQWGSDCIATDLHYYASEDIRLCPTSLLNMDLFLWLARLVPILIIQQFDFEQFVMEVKTLNKVICEKQS